jgi:hypothetical protein
MDMKKTLKSQYHACLDMMRQVIAMCPDPLWISTDSKNHYWRIVFHALFYTHLYLQLTEEGFVRWPKHRDESQFLGSLPWPPHAEPKVDKPYAKKELLEYIDFCHAEVDSKVPALDLDAASGFDWLPFDKCELQLYNIRHLQQHIGELCERLGSQGIEIHWIGMAKTEI